MAGQLLFLSFLSNVSSILTLFTRTNSSSFLVIVTLRTIALWEKNRYIIAFLVLLLIVSEVYYFFYTDGQTSTGNRCDNGNVSRDVDQISCLQVLLFFNDTMLKLCEIS